jgi:hypothetical protein
MYHTEVNQPPIEVYAQDPEHERTCRVCGCHELDACILDGHPNCHWAKADLCSHCLNFPGQAMRYSLIVAEAAAGGAFAD